MTTKTIPAALIPELVEWLMSPGKYDVPEWDGVGRGRDMESIEGAYYCFSLGWYRKPQIKWILTTAFKAFNEREEVKDD